VAAARAARRAALKPYRKFSQSCDRRQAALRRGTAAGCVRWVVSAVGHHTVLAGRPGRQQALGD